MKKLFTLVALLTCFLGAKAEVEKVYSIDYSTYNGFPFFVMGYVPEWIDGVMTDFGADYRYVTQADLDGDGDNKWKDGESSVGTVKTNNGTEYQKVTGAGPYWHQYSLGETYTVKLTVKASATVNVNTQFGNWGSLIETGVAIPASDDFTEVEWEVKDCLFSGNGFICIQPGTSTATIELKKLEVLQDKGDVVPQVWLQMITDNGNPAAPEGDGKYVGDAEFGAWPDWALEKTDGVNINWRGNRTGEICAWSIVRGENIDPSQEPDPVKDPDGNVMPEGKPRPFPCKIEVDPANPDNHLFVVHSTPADNQFTDWQAWDNQFFIMSPRAWKEGEQVRIKFRYKADKAAKAETQVHHQNPSHYLIWHAIGDVNFTEEWQDFEKTVSWQSDMAGGWCVAFNLNVSNKEANTFYFDDLSWETLKLDHGLFVAGKGNDFDYDYAQATQFVEEEADLWVATVGTKGKQETWVNEVQISTVRGDRSAFLGATLKPNGSVKIDAEGQSDWLDYTESSQAKIKVPAGVYKISIDTESKQMHFEQLEGEAAAEPVAIVTNETECVVHGAERDWRGKDNDGNLIEEQEGTGQPWDNQFWIAANRDLSTGEVTVLKFKYKGSTAARTSTQAHKVGDDGKPCTYLNWQAIGDVNFTEEWQDFEKEFTVPEGDNGMRSIVFNMAEIKGACDYYLKDFQWYIKDAELEAEGKTMENLINATGADNFWIKENKGTPTAIRTVVTEKMVSNVTYNLAGQRVSKDYKGIVVKNGKKVVLK